MSEKTMTLHISNVAAFGQKLLADEKPLPLASADLHSARVFLANHPGAETSLKRFAKFLFDTGRGTSADDVFDLQELRRR